MHTESFRFEERTTLTAAELAAIHDLVAQCDAAEGIALKFNWDMMAERDGEHISDILAYQGDVLVGAAPIDSFGSFAEITLAVHPQHRRQGIGRELFRRARNACIEQTFSRVLLVSVNGAETGKDFIATLGLPYAFSEYRMELQGRPLDTPLPPGFALRPATEADRPELERIFAEGFGGNLDDAKHYVDMALHEDGSSADLATIDGAPIGQIGILVGDHGAYIRGVAVQTASRGYGYGRAMLAETVRRLLAEGHTNQTLDVETQNSNALGLYESCGFRQINGFHYYTVDLGT